jgi:hypothetical protein
MFQKQKLRLQIEYHWLCVRLLRKQLHNANTFGKISLHKRKAGTLSEQYEILIGLRNEKGVFIH